MKRNKRESKPKVHLESLKSLANADYGQLIKCKLYEKGMSVEYLADKIGMGTSTLYKRLSDNDFKFNTLTTIFDVLNFDPFDELKQDKK